MKKTYKRGDKVYIKYGIYDRSLIDIEEYIIVQVDNHEICLINTITWNRWENPKKVKNIDSITKKEIDKIIGDDVELVTKKEYDKFLTEIGGE